MSTKATEEKKESKEEEKDKKKKKDKDKKDKEEKKDDKKDGKKKKKKDEEGEGEEDGESSPRTKRKLGADDPHSGSKLLRNMDDHGPREKACFLHGEKLVYFCETCEEPICDKCILLGPHNNQLHRINGMNEAFVPRADALRRVVDMRLIPKRQELIAQMQRIDNRIEKIKYVKNMIEKDIKAEFARTLDKLRMAEGSKTAVLLHSVSDFQKEVDKIDDLTALVLELTKENTDPTDLLIRMRQLADEIELTSSRPIKREIEVTPDLPMDLEVQRESLEKMKIAQEIIDFKDNVITQLIVDKEDKYDQLKKELKDNYDKLKADIEARTKTEIDGWLRIADRCNELLKDSQLVCFFCGEVLNDENVNGTCAQNNRINIPLHFEGFTEEFPDRTILARLRHFFGHPVAEAIDPAQAKVRGSRAEKLFENQTFRMQFRLQLEIMLSKIKKYYIAKTDELEKLFKTNDKTKKGIVSTITFAYILHETCGIAMEEVETLQSFLDPDKKHQINYVEMLQLFKDPTYLAEFINKRFPQLKESELVRVRREREKGPLKANIVGAFDSIIDRPVSRIVGSVIPTSSRDIPQGNAGTSASKYSVIPTSGRDYIPTSGRDYIPTSSRDYIPQRNVGTSESKYPSVLDYKLY